MDGGSRAGGAERGAEMDALAAGPRIGSLAAVARMGSVAVRGVGRVALAGILLLGATGPAGAQWDDGPSVLSLLPLEGTVALDETLTGSLTTEDYLAAGRRVAAYAFEGGAGDPLIIDLVSEDFDAYLSLIGPDSVELATDDDSGGACHARISTFLESGGVHRIVVSSLSGYTGAFTLTVGNRMGPLASGECGGPSMSEVLDIIAGLEPEGTLSLDGTREVSGELTPDDPELQDGSFGEAWLVGGTPGTTVWIDLVSTAFDAMMTVVDPGRESYDTDDDSGGACNSRMRITLGEEPHVVVASSLFGDETGPFTLRISESEGPRDTGPCPDEE